MAKAKVEDLTAIKPLANQPACRRCALEETSGTVCCKTHGKAGARIMLIGEALGANEEDLGRPFVGDAGRKLNFCFSKAKLSRKEVLIGNAVRCRPPNNRKPKKSELVACWPFVLHDILSNKPKVIVALGATAFEQLQRQPGKKYKLDSSKGRWRGFPIKQTYRYVTPKGKVFEHTCWLVGTFHPSAALSDWVLDDYIIRDLETAKELAKGETPLKHPDTVVHVAKRLVDVKRLFRLLKRAPFAVTDLETTGLDPHEHKILCAGFCIKAGEAHVLPLLQHGAKPFWKPAELQQILQWLAEWIERAKLVGQGIKFDLKFYRALLGIKDYHVVFDTMNAHHCLQENHRHNLTFLAQWFLCWDKYDSALDAFKEDDRGSFADAPNEVLWQYCGYDCDATFRLRKIFKPMLREEKQLTSFRTELNLINALADVEYRGLHASKERIKEMADDLRLQRKKAQRTLARIALALLGPKVAGEKGELFNPNSPAQLRPLLMKAGADLRKKTPSGAFSTDKYVLAALALKKNRAGTIARAQRDIRSLNKKLSYLDEGRGGGFIVHVKSANRMHPTYNVTVARTARLSATDPHIQTVPRTGGLRSMITPDVPGRDIFLSADYNKVELCVMAWLSNDRVMVRELLGGVDLHTHMAVTTRLMRVPTEKEFKRISEEISSQERGVAKGVNFGVPYGRQAPSIAEANPEAFPATMPRGERIAQVEKVLEAYAEKYRGVMRYMDRQIRRAKDNHYLRSYLFGRKRRFHGMQWFNSRWAQDCAFIDRDLGHLENEAKNFEIQDTASTILNRATKRCYDGIGQTRIPGFRIVLTLHDQLLFNCPLKYADEAEALVVKWMETALKPDKRHKYEMPITVDVKRQEAWGVELGGKQEYE